MRADLVVRAEVLHVGRAESEKETSHPVKIHECEVLSVWHLPSATYLIEREEMGAGLTMEPAVRADLVGERVAPMMMRCIGDHRRIEFETELCERIPLL